MKTLMAKKETVSREWLLVDAKNMPLGRVASQVAAILRGKHKPIFTPHVDCGDYVVVINTDKMILTGKKDVQKLDRRYSGFPGGLKEVQYKDLMEKKSDYVLEKAVKGMLPKNTLGREMAKKLKVYKDENHPHQAQNPKKVTLKGEGR
mgnify:CR=1 FL=1